MRFVFTDSNQKIAEKLREAMINKLYSNFYSSNSRKYIEDIVRKFVKNFISASKTWKSLSGGDPQGLDKHFGIPKEEVASRLETLLDIWSNQIKVETDGIKRQSQRFSLSYKFSAIRADWAEVLGSEAGVTINESRNHPEGQRLHWLSWLLEEGDQLVIDGYQIHFGNHPTSRSGGAIMKPEMTWRIPQEFAPFHSDNNFITRQLQLVAKNQDFRNNLIVAMKAIFTGNLSKNSNMVDLAGDIEI